MSEKKRKYKMKGEFGYIDFMKKFNFLLTLILFIIAAGLFIIGLCVFDSKANLLTIIGALFVIPAARYTTVWILFMQHKSGTEEQYEKALGLLKPGNLLYSDALITSTEKAYNLQFAVITGDKILALYNGKEKLYKVQEYVASIFQRKGFDYKVTVTDEEAKFFSLLKASDSAADMVFADDEERERYESDRREICTTLESYMP